MIQECLISVRKPQEDEIGTFIAYKKREGGICSFVNINYARMDINY